MAQVTIYTTKTCPYCIQAKALLSKKNIPYTEIPVDNDPDLREKVQGLSGLRTVPQIFIDEKSIGGYDALERMVRLGELDPLLTTS